jgi:hypothetical protein
VHRGTLKQRVLGWALAAGAVLEGTLPARRRRRAPEPGQPPGQTVCHCLVEIPRFLARAPRVLGLFRGLSRTRDIHIRDADAFDQAGSDRLLLRIGVQTTEFGDAGLLLGWARAAGFPAAALGPLDRGGYEALIQRLVPECSIERRGFTEIHAQLVELVRSLARQRSTPGAPWTRTI